MISVHFQGKPFSITVIQIYAPTSNAEEAEVEWFYEDLQDLLELTPKKDVLFILGPSTSSQMASIWQMYLPHSRPRRRGTPTNLSQSSPCWAR